MITLLLTGCTHATDEQPAETDSIEWMLERTDLYLTDREFRRAELEASMWKPELSYARKRLAAYGLEDRGWDFLPLMDTRVATVSPDGALHTTHEIFDGETPQTREQWLELGERVFHLLPMRRDAYLDWIADKPQLQREVGMQTTSDGSLRGVVEYTDPRGRTRMALTCGTCHANNGTDGAAARSLDLGKGRALFAEARGADPLEFSQWGPGTVDVTDDGVLDALAIPNLFGVSEQSHLNRSGAVKVASPASLAIRFETQYIEGHSLERRPDRRLTWALAMYVLSLEAPTPETPSSEGRKVFDQACAHCHSPEQGYSGGLVAADEINSDPQASQSTFRGTGFYKVPSLMGASLGGPFLHDASVDNLDELLASGHPKNQQLTPEERSALLSFLNSL